MGLFAGEYHAVVIVFGKSQWMLKGSIPCKVEFKVFVEIMGVIVNKTLFGFGFFFLTCLSSFKCG